MTAAAEIRSASIVVVFLLLPAFVAPSEPQATRKAPAKAAAVAGDPDGFGGYSFLRSGEASLHGGELSASRPFRGSRRLWLVADLSGHFGSFAGANLKQFTLLVGARLAPSRKGRLRPFGDALVGGARRSSSFVDPGNPEGSVSSSATAWGGALGVGTDYRLSGPWALRGQAHLLLLRASGGWDADPRLSMGVAYRFRR